MLHQREVTQLTSQTIAALRCRLLPVIAFAWLTLAPNQLELRKPFAPLDFLAQRQHVLPISGAAQEPLIFWAEMVVCWVPCSRFDPKASTASIAQGMCSAVVPKRWQSCCAFRFSKPSSQHLWFSSRVDSLLASKRVDTPDCMRRTKP